ncbi:hypothetical protein QUC31_014596 [Theobroma cacao]
MSRSLDQTATGEIEDFATWILNVGDGCAQGIGPNVDDDTTVIKIPNDLLVSPGNNPTQTICSIIYPDFAKKFTDISYLKSCHINLCLNYKLEKKGGTIQIYVARIWHSINYKQANDIISLDFLATDDKGNAIQAIIHKIHMKEFESILKEGNVYCISNFKVSKPKKSYNVISAPCAITITSKTKIVKASSSALSFQRNYFQFLEFEHLPHRYKINETLTDIISLIISMSKVTAIYVSNKSTKDNHLLLRVLHPNYVDLNIPIVADMKARFDEKNAPVLLLDVCQRPQIPPDQQENHNRVTIKQLLQIDHSKAQTKTYTCIATIKEFESIEIWYYIGCKICMKTLQQISDTFWCPDAKHGEQLPYL